MQSLHQFQRGFEAYLAEQAIKGSPAELYDPANYILRLGGKRLRPVSLLMAYSLYDKNYRRALPAALAIETFHNFTLVHDDIMDEAPLRRGFPTVHEKYDLNTGILSGDVMLVLAYRYLLKMKGVAHLTEAIEVFTQTAIEVCEGQQMDMNFENRTEVTIEEYLKMIELKTSVLVAAAMKMGALLAGAPTEEADLLYGFGKNLGIAFQIQDDLLDTYGDPEKFGKKVGGDIAQNKKTFLYLKALEVAPMPTKEELQSLYSKAPLEEGEKVRRTIQVYDKLNVKSLTEEAKSAYQLKALGDLAQLGKSGRNVTQMKKFAEILMNRQA